MSYRVVQYHLDDFVTDSESVEASINEACRRDHRRYRMSGVCQTMDDRVVFLFEEDATGEDWNYVVKPFAGETAADVVGEVHSRWQGKYSTRGLVQLNQTALGIFESSSRARQHAER